MPYTSNVSRPACEGFCVFNPNLTHMAHARIDQHFIEHFHLLNKNEIIVYTYLRRRANSASNQCNPKQAKIAADTKLPPSRVSESIAGLEKKGWVLHVDGCFRLAEKITETVRQKVTKSVRRSYGKRNSKLRNLEVGVTESVTLLNKDIEHTNEQTNEQYVATATFVDSKSFGHKLREYQRSYAAPTTRGQAIADNKAINELCNLSQGNAALCIARHEELQAQKWRDGRVHWTHVVKEWNFISKNPPPYRGCEKCNTHPNRSYLPNTTFGVIFDIEKGQRYPCECKAVYAKTYNVKFDYAGNVQRVEGAVG